MSSVAPRARTAAPDHGRGSAARPPSGLRGAAPSALGTVRLLALLSLRRARRGRLLWLSAGILGLPVLAAGFALASGQGGAGFFDRLLDLMIRYVAPFVMALNASATVAEEVQGKTITYLFSRPVARWALPLGKYLGNLVVNALLLCVAITAIYLLSMVGEGSDLFRELSRLGAGLFAMALAAVHFGAVAAAFGAMVTSFPFVVTLAYLLVIEVAASFLTSYIKVIAMTVHLRAIAGIYHPETTMFFSDPPLSLAISLPVVLVMTALWLVIALSFVGSTEYRTDK